jgi:F0F1-type ATP synthase beta subunit
MAEIQGVVSQVLGAVVDVGFPEGKLPEIFDAVSPAKATKI